MRKYLCFFSQYHDIYVDGELQGAAEKQDGVWWVDVDGVTAIPLAGGFRSPAKALAQVEA